MSYILLSDGIFYYSARRTYTVLAEDRLYGNISAENRRLLIAGENREITFDADNRRLQIAIENRELTFAFEDRVLPI